MADEIIRGMKLDPIEQFTTIHNYIDTEDMILRKRAVSALGEKYLYPLYEGRKLNLCRKR